MEGPAVEGPALLGKAALQITDVKLQDAGVYCCLISYGGADYKLDYFESQW